MRTKKSFSFNEEEEAKDIILNGFPKNTIDYGKMYIIAKYLKGTFGYGEIRLERELIKFCKKQDKNFNPVIDVEIIKKWVKSAMKYGLRKIEQINISQKEIDFLKTIETTKDRKILFMILVIAKGLKKGNTKLVKGKIKTSDNYYIRYNNLIDIIHMTKQTNISEIKLANILYKYKKLFTFYDAERELIRLEYTDKNPEKIVHLKNVSNMLENYETLFGSEKYVICERCDKKVTMTNGNQKYCPECSKIIRKEKQKELMRKRRSE